MPLKNPPPASGSNQDNPEQLFWQSEQHRIVARALESPPSSAVVELTYYHACSASEIAQRLEEAEATVRSRLRLARQRLAHCLVRQDWYRRRLQAPPTSGPSDHVPTAPAVEVICITLLINRPPWRELRIGSRECDARPDGEQLRRSNNKGAATDAHGFGAPTNREKLRHVECAIASEGGQPEMIGGQGYSVLIPLPLRKGDGGFQDA